MASADAARPRRILILAGVCVLYAGACLVNITAPFLRHQETVPARYGAFARNFVRLGILESRLGMVAVNSPDPSVFGDWRDHHYPQRPSLSPIALSVWFRLFGDSEASIRLHLMLIGLASILAFSGVAGRLLGETDGLVATAVFALNPMFLYFSIIAIHFSYALLFSLLAWSAALRIGEGRKHVVLLFVWLVLGCFSDWPAYYAALSLALYARRGWKSPLSYGILAAAVGCFGVNLLHRWWLDPETGKYVGKLLSVGAQHLSLSEVSPIPYVLGEAREFGLYFTGGVCVAAVVGTVVLVRRRQWPPLLFSLFGLSEIVFMEQARGHDYLSFSVTPFMALAAAVGLRTCRESARFRPAAVALGILAAAQAAWICGDRLTRQGGNEPGWRSAVAIRKLAAPDEKVLLFMVNGVVQYYADRYVASIDSFKQGLIPPGDPNVRLRAPEDLMRYLDEDRPDYDFVVLGAAESALDRIAFFGRYGIGEEDLERFWFYPPDHPLRRYLEDRAVSTTTEGAFVFYRLRSKK